MANGMFTRALREIVNGNLDLVNDTIRVMLLDADSGSAYSYDPDDEFVDAGGGNDPVDAELSGTGYVAGHGNAGRQLVSVISLVVDDANDRLEVQASLDNTWSSINAGTIQAAIVFREGTSDDTDALLIAYVDSANPSFPVTTVGQDFTIDWSAEGVIQFPA